MKAGVVQVLVDWTAVVMFVIVNLVMVFFGGGRGGLGDIRDRVSTAAVAIDSGFEEYKMKLSSSSIYVINGMGLLIAWKDFALLTLMSTSSHVLSTAWKTTRERR